MHLFRLINFLFFTPNFKKNNIHTYVLKKIELNYKNKNFEIKNKTNYIPKSDNQLEYKKSLINPNINLLLCIGPAGSGKTLFACKYAIESLEQNKISKIIITRPTIPIEENMGFLPGTIKEKMYPWTIPIFDVFEEYYSKKEINKLVNDNLIEIAPLGFMQGRTFKNAVIIADEMQNSTPNQMFMLLTRLGEKSKMIITGDLMQTKNENNGLNDIIKKLNKNYYQDELYDKKIKIINMKNIDIQRHQVVSTIIDLYNK
jgi:phosphate starvation-inducible PhoH-like protein